MNMGINCSVDAGRRDFLRMLGSFAAAAAAGCVCPCSGRRTRFAVQVYSLNKVFWKDTVRVLSALKAGGYDGVELYDYDYGGMAAKTLRKMCDDAGLTAMGTHLNGDVYLIGDELKRTLDFAAEAGFESVVTPHAKRDSADGYKKFGHAMGLAAEAAASYGMKVGVHATYHHFTTRYDGVSAWDMIYSDASPLLQQQVDTANALHVGEDLIALLRKYPGRHHSIHLKENTPTVDGVFGVPPTDGGPVVPWKEVFDFMADDPGHEWYVVEAEGRPDSVEPCIANRRILREWLGV